MRKNIFIAFEGIDGSGKSTQVKLLAAKLEAEGHKVYATAEPTDSQSGTLLRKILKGSEQAGHRSIAGLFLADRLYHLLNETDGLVKKMREGFTVITDRYYFSSYAYHSVHLQMDWVINANSICADILKPDLNIYLDISPETAMQRITSNRSSVELFETRENLRKVREKYLQAFELLKAKEHIFTTSGSGAVEEIANTVWVQVARLL